MNIGIDAKRAYHNGTGLGVFNRLLIDLLVQYYPSHQYYLFNPKPGRLYQNHSKQAHEVLPQKKLHKFLKSAWRSKWVINDLKKLEIELYHGTSQEIPMGIPQTGISSVVTIHDLFPELYPSDFKPIDVKIYRTKTRYACNNANMIMATSNETKNHIVNLYGINPEKIDVAYQSCDQQFTILETDERKQIVRKKYNLPDKFFLHVGTIIERKNLLNICKALKLVKKDIPIPLVVVGKGGAYKKKVKEYIAKNNLDSSVIFLSDQLIAQGKNPFVATEDFPALYQLSTATIYPSFYEGFGIPIIEAMNSGVPVITSNTSCMPEIGGDAAFYVDPNSSEEIAAGLQKFYGDSAFRKSAIKKGFENAKRFAPDVYVKSVVDIYKSALQQNEF